MSNNCTAYDGMKYYLAFKKERSNKWKVQPHAFLLHYTASHLTGQFVTTMWYNQLIIDSEPIYYAVLEVKKEATIREKRMALDRLNQGDTSDVIFMDSISQDQLRDGYETIDMKLNALKTENMDKSKGAPCKTHTLKMDHNRGISLNMTMQGTWDVSDPDKHHYTITLPMFQKTI